MIIELYSCRDEWPQIKSFAERGVVVEFAEVYVGLKIGALKEVVFEPGHQGWMMFLRDDEDALLPLTKAGQACVFESLSRASELARMLGFRQVSLSPKIKFSKRSR